MNQALDAIFDQLNHNRLFHIDRTPADETWQRLDASLQGDWMTDKYRRFATDYPGLDRRGQGAFAIGRISYVFATILAACDLTLQQVPQLTPESVWQKEDDNRLWLRLPEPKLVPANDESLRTLLINLMSAFITPIKSTSRLSTAAQWRLVSDSVAVAWQMVGQTLNQEAAAQDRAMAILSGKGSPLHNRQTGFTQVSTWVPGADQTPVKVTKSYRIRGGCCRLYTADNQDYCATCVLLKPDEQNKRLQDSLRLMHSV